MERYTCIQLKNWGLLSDEDDGTCCPYCHKWDDLSHDGEEEKPEEEVLTYIRTPGGRLIGLCCQMYDDASVMEANAWLDVGIDKALSQKECS